MRESFRGCTDGAAKNIPDVDVDLYAEEVLLNPYPSHAILRDAAPIVRLPKYDIYVMSRFADVQAALKNGERFSSASGVAVNDMVNAGMSRSTLVSDDPVHAERRKIINRPLSPARLNAVRARVVEEAERLIECLVQRKSFDAATDLSRHLPVTIVYDLIGVPQVKVEDMLRWTECGFNMLGPIDSALMQNSLRDGQVFSAYAAECTYDSVKPGGWAAELFEHAKSGAIDEDQARALLFDYMGPSLDTTVLATTSAVKLFADHPGQWDTLRANPNAIPMAINEVLRLESPIQSFSRLVTEDTPWGDQTLPRGARLLLLYGSANRDERRWEEPERFDIHRSNGDQLGFGHGVHTCAGANLARLEMSAILTAMILRIASIELHTAKLLLNNALRGYSELRVTVH